MWHRALSLLAEESSQAVADARRHGSRARSPPPPSHPKVVQQDPQAQVPLRAARRSTNRCRWPRPRRGGCRDALQGPIMVCSWRPACHSSSLAGSGRRLPRSAFLTSTASHFAGIVQAARPLQNPSAGREPSGALGAPPADSAPQFSSDALRPDYIRERNCCNERYYRTLMTWSFALSATGDCVG